MANGYNHQRALQQLNPEVIKQEYRELRYDNGEIIPTKFNLIRGVASVRNLVMTQKGTADYFIGKPTSSPKSSNSATFDEFPVIGIWSGYDESFWDIETQSASTEFNWQEIALDLQMACRQAIAEKSNKLQAFGETKFNVTGFLNDPNVPVQNDGENPYAMSGTELRKYLTEAQRLAYYDTNYTRKPTTMEVSPTLYTELITKLVGTDEDVSVRNALLNDGIFTSIEESPELLFDRLEDNAVLAGGTNKDRIVLYDKNPQTVCRQVQKEMIRMIPKEWLAISNLTRSYGMFMLQTPPQFKQPLFCRYINIAKAP